MERSCAWMIARLLVAVLLLQGPAGITGQTPPIEQVDCKLPENNPVTLETAITGGLITANALTAYTKGQFACLNADALNKISAVQLALLFDSQFRNNASVAQAVTLKVTDLQKLGDLLAAIKEPLDANVTAAMMAVVWPVLNVSLATMPEANVTDWFTLRLKRLLPAVTVAQIADIPINVSCANFTVISGTLSSVYDNVSDSVRRAVVEKVKVFVKQDSCCNSALNSRTLLLSYFGNYRKSATYAEFAEVFLQFNGFGVEDLLTTVQKADFAATDKVIQLNTKLKINPFDNITDLEIFVDEFNIKAAGKLVPQYYQQFLMGLACPVLIQNLDTMTDANVSKWFVTKLPPLFLPGITTDCLNPAYNNILFKIPCSTMSTISGSLSKLNNTLDLNFKKSMTSLITNFLTLNSNCSTAMTSITLFPDYFGNFSEHIIYTDFCKIFPPFNAETVLKMLTPVQLAGYSATNKVLNNVTKLTPIFANYLNDINAIKTFMIEFNFQTEAKELPEASRVVLFQGVWDKLILNLPTMESSEVSWWFGTQLSPNILPGITAADVASIPVSISCPAFSSIINGLNSVYAKLNDTIKTAVVTKIKEFVKSPASCSISSTQLITMYFMKFMKNITYAEIVDVLPSFDAGQVLASLTVVQLADYAATDNVLNNTAILSPVFSTINYNTLGPFLDEFNVKANGKTVPKASQGVLMQNAWPILGPTLATLSDEDVRKWFVARLSPHVLPGITNVDADTIPVTLSCPAFTTIVGSLSAVYSQLNENVKPQMVKKIKNFVKPAVASSKCTPSITSSNLLTDYFGKFRDNATEADFKEVFPSYAAIASPIELGDYAATDTVLNDAPSLAAIFPKLSGLGALGQFLDEFNQKATGKTVPKASQAALMQGAWEKMSPTMNSFTDADVKTWFVDRLSPLILPGITAANVAALPTVMSCNNFDFLVGILDAGLSSNDTKQATYQWIMSYLNKAKSGTLPPCFASKNSWIVDNMGQSFLLSKLSDLNGLVQDTTQRKTFVLDASTLKLLETPNNMDIELRRYLVQMMNEASLPLSSVPKPLLCTYVGEYGSSLPVALFVGLESYLSNCLKSITLPRDMEKVSLNLLTTYTDLKPASIQNLGSAVVYAPLNAIDKNLSSTTALLALDTLSNQTGWNPGQAQNIVRKLKAANFTVNNADALTKLGGLVSGVPSSTFTNLDSNQLLAFATKSNPDNVATIPDGVQSVIVNKLLMKNPTTQLMDSLPPSLLAHIPAGRLQNAGNWMPKNLAKGQWSEGQALVLVGNLVKTQTANWTEIIRQVHY
uniref:Uncharacterized protein LOC116946043 n=1 Tax=Petromyzon marinus TaxID=7757 RepID=A0AAJ7TF85_PETMA|nr:uncharacterized protein LOC116946043 [Petromyzon marinus]